MRHPILNHVFQFSENTLPLTEEPSMSVPLLDTHNQSNRKIINQRPEQHGEHFN